MMRRIICSTAMSLVVVAVMIIPVVAQDFPRTASGQPDLQGVWDFRTITPMERPEGLSDKPFLTAEEAAEIENIRALQDEGRDDEVPADIVGNYNTFWFDRGTSVIDTMRTSLVVDPPEGRIPALTPAAERARVAMSEARKDTGPHEPTPGGWVDDLGSNGLQVRCVTGFNSGPPMTPGGYNNNVQIFQTADTVVLYNEMNHNPRVVPLDGRPHTLLRQWTGESRGYWDGDTLEVETRNFNGLTQSFSAFGTSKDKVLTERFSRIGPYTVNYEWTIEDPSTFADKITAIVPMTKVAGEMYEYACHEGNYGMENILRGARMEEDEQ